MAAAWNGVTTCTNAGYRAAFLGVLSGFSAQNYRCHFVFDGYAWRLPSWHEPSAWPGENPLACFAESSGRLLPIEPTKSDFAQDGILS